MLQTEKILVWAESDGTIWEHLTDGEPCEFDPNQPDELFVGSGYACWQPSEYMGISKDGKVTYLCAFHFEPIKEATILSSIEE